MRAGSVIERQTDTEMRAEAMVKGDKEGGTGKKMGQK